jgi:predicted helicase
MSFLAILEKYRTLAFHERDKGDRFERLMQAYLRTDPKYANLFKNVWLWSEFPGKSDLGGGDTGIDLVGFTGDGDYWAIQCKFFQDGSHIDKKAVDSFLSTSSRQFQDVDTFKTARFSHRLWISTTNSWGANATEAIRNQNPPVTRINLTDLIEAPVDWAQLDKGVSGDAARTAKKSLRPHQISAVEDTHKYFQTHERGKLIMACGTGKTFTSLRIADKETNGKGLILFLVPSIALLGQTLREWSADAEEPINAICICSDPKVSKKSSKNEDSDSTSVVDLALPASTNPEEILKQFLHIQRNAKPGMTVVFSTYQSIEVISKAQKVLMKPENGFGAFDLIICDEAHRTTGVTIAGDDESAFTKVHDNGFIQAKKRLYMTATPRLYSDDIKSKAAQADATLCSMDDTALYGDEIYRIGFGVAVEQGLLADYKVLILTLSETDVPPAVQKMIADKESEINTDDASKLIGCINALSKKVLGDQGVLKDTDPEPMRRAVAFCPSIATSRKITSTFNIATDAYINELPSDVKDSMVGVQSKHVDGTMDAPTRDELLTWLKTDTTNNECRILTNVRCLSEGVDVPSLDAVMFLSARNSQVDVVQSVGRVMRLAPNKKYGYIIIPVVVPANVEADKALDDNERYKVVWTVLNALRAHDDRFNAVVNKIELNKSRPNQILVGRPEYGFDDEGKPEPYDPEKATTSNKDISAQLALQFEELQHVVFARMVQKVGDRRYWEQWAKSVAEIAERQVERLTRLIATQQEHAEAFEQFMLGLRRNINPSIKEQEAIEMLSQHVITKPVFEALFEGYSFVKNNPISVSMQQMLDLLEGQAIEKDLETLNKFYDSVRKRAAGIDNAEGKQRVIIELYDKFFKTAFPKMVEKLGIVYTPVEVVDFIINSVADILEKEFGRSISDENVHILDPFTGTGTFITRLLQSGRIRKEDLLRKYQHEIHANEIVLLAYYIAAVNIENAFHEAMGQEQDYESFEGICLTDTFQLGESSEETTLGLKVFPENSARVTRQKKAPLRVIIGNPPYSVGQKSANDNAQNQKYEKLERRIAQTYAKESLATKKNSLYDSYIKAFRWSTDRLKENNEHGGIICFVSNGAWLDGNSADGFRKSLEKEFSAIYVFNLRGNARTTGELNRKEGNPLFGATGGKGGSKTPIAITLMVKKTKTQNEKAIIHYHDIGDYLSRKTKLELIRDFKTFANPKLPLTKLAPNEHGDWISLRNDVFSSLIPLTPEKKYEVRSNSFFKINSLGTNTNRDAWVYNSSIKYLLTKMKEMVNFFNLQIELFKSNEKVLKGNRISFTLDNNPLKISWSSSLLSYFQREIPAIFEPNQIKTASYRPFFKQNLYFGDKMIHRRGQMGDFFPTPTAENLVICVSASYKDGSVLITNAIPDLHFNGDTQAFPLYYYEENNAKQTALFDGNDQKGYIRREAISDFILERARQQYGKSVSKEDIFFYVYGFLHSPEYRETFANDLKKMLPRLPLVESPKDFWAFSQAGRALADLHLNYETQPKPEGVEVRIVTNEFPANPRDEHFKVTKMRFPAKGQKDIIHFNSYITIGNIPAKAYDYVVNGKSAIEWIMERYQITTHKESGITNDPNDWATEVGNPRYILDLLLSIITVSLLTVDIVNSLPKLSFAEVVSDEA